MKKHLSLLAAAGAVGLVGLGAASASALSDTSSSSSDSLVDRLVAKFNLSKSDVQAVFDEERQARDAERQAEVSDRLQDAVDDGDITADQKTKIEAKLKELQSARAKERDELEAWAEKNGIDARYLMGHGRGDGNRLDDAVEGGDLTDAQKTLIENKQDELETAREKQRDELEQWAEDNDVDERYLMGGGMGMGHGHGGRF